MAITRSNVSAPSNQILFNDTVMGNSADGIKSSSAVVYWVTIDNTANVGAASYVKLYNVASGSVTVGTTAPDELVYCPAGVIVTRMFVTGATPGVTFGTALSACCVTTGGTAGTTSPSSSVIVTVAYV